MSNLDQKEQLRFNTEVMTPERADAVREAADLVGGVTVSVLDPSVSEEADRFAITSAQAEKAFHASGKSHGMPKQPRTPDQIKKEVVEHALKDSKVLVVLQYNQQDLGNFWRQADQISSSR